MIWWYNMALRINPCCPKDVSYPLNEMLHHSLKQLMKDIRGNGNENVHEGERFPERMDHSLQARLVTHNMKAANVTISQTKCVNCHTLDTGQEHFIFAKLPRGNSAFRAPTVVRASYKRLLWVVTHENGKDRVTSPPDTVATHHCHPCFTIGLDRTKDVVHACME